MKKSESKAREILSRFDLELNESWEGSRPVWHAWHTPHPIYLMAYREYVDRVVEIAECKPLIEQEQRLRSMRPATHVFSSTPEIAALERAYDAWRRAAAEWKRARDASWEISYDAWESAADAWQRADDAWESAYDAWQRADAEEIAEAHAEECRSGCGWNGEAMVFN